LATQWTNLVRFQAGAGTSLFTTESRPSLGPIQLPIQRETWCLSIAVKTQGKGNYVYTYTFIPPYVS